MRDTTQRQQLEELQALRCCSPGVHHLHLLRCSAKVHTSWCLMCHSPHSRRTHTMLTPKTPSLYLAPQTAPYTMLTPNTPSLHLAPQTAPTTLPYRTEHEAKEAGRRHHSDSQVGMFDAQVTSHNDSSKGQGSAHVDCAVVEGHGCGLALGEQLGDETEAYRVLCGLGCRKANPGCQQLPEAVHLHLTPQRIIARHRSDLISTCMSAAHRCEACTESLAGAGTCCYAARRPCGDAVGFVCAW